MSNPLSQALSCSQHLLPSRQHREAQRCVVRQIQLFREHLESDELLNGLEGRLQTRGQHQSALDGGANIELHQRVAALEAQLQKQSKQIAAVGDETAAAKVTPPPAGCRWNDRWLQVSIIARVDDRMLALTRDLQTEVWRILRARATDRRGGWVDCDGATVSRSFVSFFHCDTEE